MHSKLDAFDEFTRIDLRPTARHVRRSRVRHPAVWMQVLTVVTTLSGAAHSLDTGSAMGSDKREISLAVLSEDCGLSIEHSEPESVCLPPEACEQLVLRCSDVRRTVSGAEDLVGFVEIGSPGQALEYLRFFSSEKTNYLFERAHSEVFVGGDDDCLAFCLPSESWRELRLQEPIAQVTESGEFVVTRSMVRPGKAPGDPQLFVVREVVSRDGRVRELSSEPREIEDEMDRARLTFPGLM